MYLYKRFYNKKIIYTNKEYSNEELYFLSLSNDNFLKLKSYNKFSTLSIKYLDCVIANKNENITSKFFYTIITAILSNAKRFNLLKGDTNTIPCKLLLESLKILNNKTYNKKKFIHDLYLIKDSSFFSEVNKEYITLTNKKSIIKNHSLYSDRVLIKGERFTESKFIKESVYFLKSKPLATYEWDNLQVISDIMVGRILGISSSYISMITRGFLKAYSIELTCGRGYYLHKELGYRYKLRIQGEIYSSKTIGSRMVSNIFFKSIINKDNKIIKKNRMLSKTKNSKFKLETFDKKSSIQINKYGALNLINKHLRPSEYNIQSNKLLTNQNVILNIVSNNIKNVNKQIIKIVNIIEFSFHLENDYKKFISTNINKYKIDDVYKKMVGYYLNLKDKKLITNYKFSFMKKIFEDELGGSFKSINRNHILSKYNIYLKEKNNKKDEI